MAITKNMDIFLIEDNQNMHLLYKKWFDYYDLNLIGIASEGQKAIDMYHNFPEKPEIIIIDCHVPNFKDESGIELAKEIRNEKNDSKFVFSSYDSEDKDKIKDFRNSYFFEKPFSFRELMNKIKEM